MIQRSGRKVVRKTKRGKLCKTTLLGILLILSVLSIIVLLERPSFGRLNATESRVECILNHKRKICIIICKLVKLAEFQ